LIIKLKGWRSSTSRSNTRKQKFDWTWFEINRMWSRVRVYYKSSA